MIWQMWYIGSSVEGEYVQIKIFSTDILKKTTNRVIVLLFVENIEGVTSLIFKSHKDIYQFR